jgi:hypothetical protein
MGDNPTNSSIKCVSTSKFPICQEKSTLQTPPLLTRVSLTTPIAFNIGSNTQGPVIYDTVNIDEYNMYDSTTGGFTIPDSGWWRINYNTCFMFEYTPFAAPGGGCASFLAMSSLPNLHMKTISDLGSVNTTDDDTVRSCTTSDTLFLTSGTAFSILFVWDPQGAAVPTSGSIMGTDNPAIAPLSYCTVERVK